MSRAAIDGLGFLRDHLEDHWTYIALFAGSRFCRILRVPGYLTSAIVIEADRSAKDRIADDS